MSCSLHCEKDKPARYMHAHAHTHTHTHITSGRCVPTPSCRRDSGMHEVKQRERDKETEVSLTMVIKCLTQILRKAATIIKTANKAHLISYLLKSILDLPKPLHTWFKRIYADKTSHWTYTSAILIQYNPTHSAHPSKDKSGIVHNMNPLQVHMNSTDHPNLYLIEIDTPTHPLSSKKRNSKCTHNHSILLRLSEWN